MPALGGSVAPVADIANLVLAIDSSQVPRAVASLDGLTAAGARAEASTVGLRGGFKGAAAEGAAMAAAAQASARAAMDQAAGFKVATAEARINTLAMRETLVVARELSRGNFTRLPGSLTLLAQGVGSQGGFGAYLSALSQQLGLIKQVQNAELAEAAAAAANATAGVEAAARKAAANVMAADTEIALAEAQVRVTQGTSAEAAAQARLAAAHEAVGVAASEAAVAENALAVSMERSNGAQAASAAATRKVIGTTGAGLIGLVIAAAGAEGAFKALQATIDDRGTLDRYAQSLVKTKEQLKDLEDKVGGFQITWGDVFHGLGKAASDALGGAAIWDAFKEGNKNAFTDALHNAVDFAAKSYGVIRGSYQTIVDDWNKFPAVLGDAFYSAVNFAIGAINKLLKASTDGINDVIHAANKIPGVNIGDVSAARLGSVSNPYAGSKLDSDLRGNINKYTGQARSKINANLETIYDDIVGAAEERIKDGLPKGRTRKPRKPKEIDDHADDTIARLDEQILSAKIALTKDVTEEASLKVQQLRVERDKTISDAQSLLNHKKITAAEFDTIRLRANQLDNLKEQKVLDDRDIKLMEQDQAIKDQMFGFQTDALKFADEMATNSSDHRKVQLEMLDIAYKQKAYDLQILEAKQMLAKDFAAAALTQNQINELPLQKAREQTLIEKRTADPLQLWAQTVPKTAKDISDAIKGIEVNGINSLAQSIAGVVTGTEKLGAAFKHIAQSIIADIVQMTIKMLIFRAISAIFGAPAVGGGGGVPGLGIAGARASGGPVSAGQTYLVGENGPELFRPSSSGLIYPHGQAANNNQAGPIEIKIGFGDAPEFAPYVQEVAGHAAGAAVKIAVDHTNDTFRRMQRPKISGGR